MSENYIYVYGTDINNQRKLYIRNILIIYLTIRD
jgi:hypothetical protein